MDFDKDAGAARADRIIGQLALRGVEALWAKGKGGGLWIRNYHYVSLTEAEGFLQTGRWNAESASAPDGSSAEKSSQPGVFEALADYIKLLQSRSMFFSSPGYHGLVEFLKSVRETDGNLIILKDGWAQRLDLKSPFRTLDYFRYDPWPRED